MTTCRAPSVALLRALRRPSTCSFCALRTASAHLESGRKLRTESLSTDRLPIPLRAQTKAEAKSSQPKKQLKPEDPRLDNWELTVGIEIHAEINTQHKLFSSAQTSTTAVPNTHVAPFDAAVPGTQPSFQKATILPAVRAALALDCAIASTSSFDRKHYFWWDQPHGYQITQFYSPFARNGRIVLYEHDDIDPADGPEIVVGIKQVQLEQDTAKTVAQPPNRQLLDFNRVSHPLIEIITLPQIHSPKTASALVRKIQALLRAVDANTTGMEMGGLRADVNVSVKRKGGGIDPRGHEYGGVIGLGQRTEIKNLSSFKAIEDAITAERDRQISVLEAGGVIEGETRGWTLGSTETKRLRGKEGEVDYRYMPDPDLPPIVIAPEVVEYLRDNMPMLPDDAIELLTGHQRYGLSLKDAQDLVSSDNGDRLDFYLEVVDTLAQDRTIDTNMKLAKVVANWVLNEVPTHASSMEVAFPYETPKGFPAAPMLASILGLVLRNEVTTITARQLLHALTAATESRTISQIVSEEGLKIVEMTDKDYKTLAASIADSNMKMVEKVKHDYDTGRGEGKLMWFVGQMVRQGEEGRVRPDIALKWARKVLLNL